MNFIDSLYCNQHFELKEKGKEHLARANGNALVAIALALNVFALFAFAMLVSPDVLDWFSDAVRDIFGRRTGRSVGKFLALIPFLITVPLSRLVLGSPKRYQKLIANFESLDLTAQFTISNRGKWYFFSSMISFAVALILSLIFLT